MRVLSLSGLFPSAASPRQGVFIKERLKGLPAEAVVQVWRCRPSFPAFRFLRPHLAEKLPEREIVEGLEVLDRPFFYVPGLFKARDGDLLASRLIREFRRSSFRPDLIDAHFAYPTGYAACRLGRAFGLPVVLTERGTMPSYLGDGRAERIRWALRAATRLVAVSGSLAAVMKEVGGPDLEVRVVPNGVDGELFRPGDGAAARRRLGIEASARVLLTVGGLVPRKGAHRVVEILPRLLERHPRLLYVVVGSAGAEGDFGRDLRARIAAAGLEERVRLVDGVVQKELPDYYRAADVFVLSTSNEGWANVIQESLACGTFVVTTDVGGNREVLGTEANGILTPFGDADRLAAAVLAALEGDHDRAAIAAFGRRRSWAAVGEEVMRVFEEACLAHRAASG